LLLLSTHDQTALQQHSTMFFTSFLFLRSLFHRASLRASKRIPAAFFDQSSIAEPHRAEPRLRRFGAASQAQSARFARGNGAARRQCRSVPPGAGRAEAGEFSGRFPPSVRSGRLSAPCSARSLRSLQVLRASRSPAARDVRPAALGPLSVTCPCNLACPAGTGLKARQMTRPTDRREP